ncbi:MAG: SAM-dependent methyltransferase [Lachnospiraceae bacterium]|nr:SAM-dependent methyltransferase [Lachnospiraceae bacterium]
MKNKVQGVNNSEEKEFLEQFEQLCRGRSAWEAWADLMAAMACWISTAADHSSEHFEKRKKEAKTCMEKLGSEEIVQTMLTIVADALDKNPEQDFLGGLYMRLNLGDHWTGQFFTSYCISHLMAEMLMGDCGKEIEEKGWTSIYDPCIGGGAMMLAAVNVMQSKGIAYQNQALFAGQDIDRIAAMMAYIQLSLRGCAGYIVVGNSLTHPMSGDVLFPHEGEGQELWLMPMFMNNIWNMRRIAAVIGNLERIGDKG